MKGGHNMSNKERVLQLIDDIPDQKLIYVVDMLNSIKNLLVEEVDPDEWDLQMINQAQEENDGTTISFEKLADKLGVTL
jgi:allophanate hydrolase subunit 1